MKQIKTVKMLREDLERENEIAGYIDPLEASEELYRRMENDFFNKGICDTFSEYFEYLEASLGKIDASLAEELLGKYRNFKKRIE